VHNVYSLPVSRNNNNSLYSNSNIHQSTQIDFIPDIFFFTSAALLKSKRLSSSPEESRATKSALSQDSLFNSCLKAGCYSWLYDGYTMVIRWLYDGYTMVIRWLYDGYTMVIFDILHFAFLHSCIPAFLHFCIPAFLHSCIPAFLHSCIPAFLHFCIPAFLHYTLNRMCIISPSSTI